MLSYVELLRLNVCALAVLGVLVGGLVIGLVSPIPVSFLVAMLVTLLISGAGNAINDYYDYEVDSINKRHRPIPSARITRENTKMFSAVLFLMGNAFAVAFLNPIAAAFVILNSALLFGYSWKLKATPFGHFIDSWLAASVFILPGLVLSDLNSSILLLAAIAFFANLSRELMKGIEDYSADRQTGKKTFVVNFGLRVSKSFAKISAVVAMIMSFLPYYFRIFGMKYLVIVLIADAMLVYSFQKRATYAQAVMKSSMFVAMLAFLVGALL